MENVLLLLISNSYQGRDCCRWDQMKNLHKSLALFQGQWDTAKLSSHRGFRHRPHCQAALSLAIHRSKILQSLRGCIRGSRHCEKVSIASSLPNSCLEELATHGQRCSCSNTIKSTFCNCCRQLDTRNQNFNSESLEMAAPVSESELFLIGALAAKAVSQDRRVQQ